MGIHIFPTQACLFLFVILFFDVISSLPLNSQVKHFPGFEGELPSKHYAGYIKVGEFDHTRHLYYYIATSEGDVSKDPVTFWLNGGPACSGIGALLQLIGPFRVRLNSVRLNGHPQVEQNPYSWTKVSSVIFVDSPQGCGYSYSDHSDDYDTDDVETINDLYEFIIKWFMEYPEFLTNPLYLAGCSYSGVIVPVLAEKIVKGNEEMKGLLLNFKGYSLGNAAIDINIENNAMVPYAYKMGLISDELHQNLTTSCNEKYFDNHDPICKKNLETFHENVDTINKCHILCLICHHDMQINMDIDEYEAIKMYEGIHEITREKAYCHEYELVPKLLFDSKHSRELLHAAPVETSRPWLRCSQHTYRRVIQSLTPYHQNLTKKGYRAFFYNGDHDMLLPYTATLAWIKTLNYSMIVQWHPWFIEGQIAGYSILYEHNLLFATFKGAGHTVMEFMPREMLIAYQRWISGSNTLV